MNNATLQAKTCFVFKCTKYLTGVFLILIKSFAFENYVCTNISEKQNDIKILLPSDHAVHFFGKISYLSLIIHLQKTYFSV